MLLTDLRIQNNRKPSKWVFKLNTKFLWLLSVINEKNKWAAQQPTVFSGTAGSKLKNSVSHVIFITWWVATDSRVYRFYELFIYFNYFMNITEIIAIKFQAHQHKHVKGSYHWINKLNKETEINQKLSNTWGQNLPRCFIYLSNNTDLCDGMFTFFCHFLDHKNTQVCYSRCFGERNRSHTQSGW